MLGGMSESMETNAPPPSYEDVLAQDRAMDGGLPAKEGEGEGESTATTPSLVDIAFLMDCTGSMGPYIQSTKQVSQCSRCIKIVCV